jgi:hypothetical protein
MALLSDASRWPDWYPGVTEIDIAAPFPAEGGKVAFKVKSAGISMPMSETVLDYQPDNLQLFQMEGTHSSSGLSPTRSWRTWRSGIATTRRSTPRLVPPERPSSYSPAPENAAS